MEEQKQGILTLECEDCLKLSSVSLSKECDECINKRKFDIVRLKTDVFIKEYDKNRKLLSVTPFFMDVRLDKSPKDAKLLKEYLLPTGAKVEILKDKEGVNTIYHLKIPETNITFEEILDITKELDSFENTNETDNELIQK